MQSRAHLVRLSAQKHRETSLAAAVAACLLMGKQLKLNLKIIIMRENEVHICRKRGGKEAGGGNQVEALKEGASKDTQG